MIVLWIVSPSDHQNLSGLKLWDCLYRRRTEHDLARLHRLGHFAEQINGQQAVSNISRAHPHIVGKLEAPLKCAGRNPPVNIARFHWRR
jgi:hypothetical protein